MVGCLYCSSSSLFPFYDGWHFQYEEVTGNFDAAFARYRSGDHTAITAVASQSSDQPIMVDCIAHYHHLDNQWHYKSD